MGNRPKTTKSEWGAVAAIAACSLIALGFVALQAASMIKWLAT